jgi:hypothetical protein
MATPAAMWAAVGLKAATWPPRPRLQPACSHLTASLSPLEPASSQHIVYAIVYAYFISKKLFYLWKILVNSFLL